MKKIPVLFLFSGLHGAYHRPSDEAGAALELGAAADDAAFHVALVKWFATLKSYPGKR